MTPLEAYALALRVAHEHPTWDARQVARHLSEEYACPEDRSYSKARRAVSDRDHQRARWLLGGRYRAFTARDPGPIWDNVIRALEESGPDTT
jgi:hypothetical protein